MSVTRSKPQIAISFSRFDLVSLVLLLPLTLCLTVCADNTEPTHEFSPSPRPLTSDLAEPTIDVSKVSPVFRDAARRLNRERTNPPPAKWDYSGLSQQAELTSRRAYWDENPISPSSDIEEIVDFLFYLEFRIELMERRVGQ